MIVCIGSTILLIYSACYLGIHLRASAIASKVLMVQSMSLIHIQHSGISTKPTNTIHSVNQPRPPYVTDPDKTTPLNPIKQGSQPANSTADQPSKHHILHQPTYENHTSPLPRIPSVERRDHRALVYEIMSSATISRLSNCIRPFRARTEPWLMAMLVGTYLDDLLWRFDTFNDLDPGTWY